MVSKSFARIEDGMVAELVTTERAIAELYHPDLVWIEVDGIIPEIGWHKTADGFEPPPEPKSAPQPEVTLEGLKAELLTLTEKLRLIEAAGVRPAPSDH